MKQIRVTVTDGVAANAHYIANATGIPYEQIYNCLLHIACEGKDLAQLSQECLDKAEKIKRMMVMDQQAATMKGV